MPYGIPASKGGESAENVAEMEACVSALTKRGMAKDAAIPVCKRRLGFTLDGGKERPKRRPR